MQARAQEEQKMREQLQPSKQQQPSQDDIYKALQAEALKLSQQQQQQQQPQPTRQTTTDEDAIFRAYQQQAMQMQKNQQPQAPMQIPPEAAKFIPTEMNNETEKVTVMQTNPIQLKLATPKSSNVDEEPSTTTMATESSSTSASPPTESFPDITSSDATPPPSASIVDSSDEQRPVGQQQQPDPSEKISDYFKQLGMRRQPEIIVDGDTAASTQATIVETSSDAQLSPAMRDFAQAAVAAVSEPEKKKTTEEGPFKMVKKA